MTKIIRHEIGRDRMYKVWHKPTGNMLLYVHEGTGSIVSPDHIYPLHKGVLCFVGSQVDHHTIPDLPHAYDRSKIFIDDTLLMQLSTLLGMTFSPHNFIFGEIDEDIEQIFNWMEQYGPAGGCLQLLSMLVKHIDNGTFIARSSVERAIAYIQEHASEPISIDQICTAIHTSKYHFCRKFKEMTGLTVMNYILKTRITMSCNMMKQYQYNITRISEECGFSSPAYFSRVFKNQMGISPLQYKKQIKGARR